MYKIPFYMEAELEQMQAAAPAEQQQQPPSGQPGAVKVDKIRPANALVDYYCRDV